VESSANNLLESREKGARSFQVQGKADVEEERIRNKVINDTSIKESEMPNSFSERGTGRGGREMKDNQNSRPDLLGRQSEKKRTSSTLPRLKLSPRVRRGGENEFLVGI